MQLAEKLPVRHKDQHRIPAWASQIKSFNFQFWLHFTKYLRFKLDDTMEMHLGASCPPRCMKFPHLEE